MICPALGLVELMEFETCMLAGLGPFCSVGRLTYCCLRGHTKKCRFVGEIFPSTVPIDHNIVS